MSEVRVDSGVSSGTFSLDGQTFAVDNNVWVIGDDHECLVIDAPHSVEDVVRVVGGRRVVAIACTHAHDDHVRIAPALSAAVDAPVLLHPDDLPLWQLTHPVERPDGELADEQRLAVAGADVTVLHTPGHAPGAVCFYVAALGVVFTGDTLFEGGAGATGRSYSNADLIVDSIRHRLFPLPPQTVVHPGHGNSTRIAAELANVR